MSKKHTSLGARKAAASPRAGALLAELRDLIHEARQQTSQVVNAALTFTYWRVGDRTPAPNRRPKRGAK